MMTIPFYDPTLSYEENFTQGPFGQFAHEPETMLQAEQKVDFFGTFLDLPFGIPAGPLLNSTYVIAALKHGYDVCTYKTVRSRAYPCHQWPNVLGVKITGDLTTEKAQGSLLAQATYQEPLSITNSFGVPSRQPDWWQVDMHKAVVAALDNQVVVASFQGTGDGTGFASQLADYQLTARLVTETKAKVVEVNLSCPNEGSAHLLCFDPKRVREIVFGVKETIGNVPLIIKIAYFESDEVLEKLIDLVGEMVDGISAINTIPARVVDEKGEQALPGEGRAVSGICGSSIRWAGLSMVERLVSLRQKKNLSYKVIGVGGVMKPSDYVSYRQKGADVVMSATGAMWYPDLAVNIKSLVVQEAV